MDGVVIPTSSLMQLGFNTTVSEMLKTSTSKKDPWKDFK